MREIPPSDVSYLTYAEFTISPRRDSLSEINILEGLRRHDPAAFRRFCDHHLSSLWRYVYAKLGAAEVHVAEDIVSETIMAWIRNVDEGLKIESPHAWLRTVAHNKINDHFRAAARVRNMIDEAGHRATNASTDEDPSQSCEREEAREAVRDAMDQLSDQHRLALQWKYLDKLSVREIAQRMEVTEKSVESVLFRARRELRRNLQTPDTTVDPDQRPTSHGSSDHRNANQPKSGSSGEPDEHTDAEQQRTPSNFPATHPGAG